LASRRIAVTGASGFIGRHVVAHLASRGDDVVPVRRPFEREALATFLNGVDAVVHLAGVVSAVRERDYFAANADGTRAIAEAARLAGAHLIYISSLAVAGPAPPSAPHSEDDPPAPINAYGRSKLAGERAILDTPGLCWTILRPGVVYGPADRALLPVFRMARLGVLPAVGRATAAYTFVHIADLVRTIATAVDRGCEGRTLFVGHPAPVYTRELLEMIGAASGHAARLVPIPMTLTRLAALAGDLVGAFRGKPSLINSRRYAELASVGFVCRVDRLREQLGIVAEIDLRRGLTETAAWYRREGWL
jgi:nucleoside-diphosphate-sugar epimerase